MMQRNATGFGAGFRASFAASYQRQGRRDQREKHENDLHASHRAKVNTFIASAGSEVAIRGGLVYYAPDFARVLILRVAAKPKFKLGFPSHAAIQTDLRPSLRSKSGRTRIPIAKISTRLRIPPSARNRHQRRFFTSGTSQRRRRSACSRQRVHPQTKKWHVEQNRRAALGNSLVEGNGRSVLARSRRFDPSGTPRA